MWINGVDLMLPVDGCVGDLTRLKGRVASEVKYNGTRVAFEVEGESVYVRNRRAVDYGGRLPELEAEARRLPDCAIDGEAVVYRDGVTWRVGSQIRCSTQDRVKIIKGMKKHPITFMAFDLLSLYGKPTVGLSYVDRKEMLQDILDQANLHVVRCASHGEDLLGMWEEVVEKGREGLVLKYLDSRYMRGRSDRWVRVKPPQHMVVSAVGYTEGSGKRASTFGALVLEDEGVYVGKVGTGFNGPVLRKLKRFMGGEGRGVTPKGEVYTRCRPFRVRVGYAEITDEGHIFQPSYQGVVDMMR